jgi:hypothetical protein
VADAGRPAVTKRDSSSGQGTATSWIAAIAVSRGLPVITQDDDFAALWHGQSVYRAGTSTIALPTSSRIAVGYKYVYRIDYGSHLTPNS